MTWVRILKKKIIEKLFQNYWRYNVFITLKKSTNLLFLDCEIFRSRNCVSFLFVFSLVLYTSSVQLLSSVQLFANPWTAAHQASLSITNSWSLLKLMSIDCVSDAVQPSPLSSPSPLALNLSQPQGLFQWVSSSNKVARVLEFQLQH